MLSNGHTVKPDKLKPTQQKDVIGVVAYLYKTENNARLKSGVKTALAAKGVNAPHGLVMSLKNASAMWRTRNDAVATSFPTSLKDMYDKGVDGYTLTKRVQYQFGSNMDEFPAFKAALDYTAPGFNENTGWSLPSESEWMDMLGDNGLNVFTAGKFAEAKNKSYGSYVKLENRAEQVAKNLNAKFGKVGTSNFDAFALNQGYWSSSEYSSYFAYCVNFRSEGDFYLTGGDRTNPDLVRPVLAF